MKEWTMYVKVRGVYFEGHGATREEALADANCKALNYFMGRH